MNNKTSHSNLFLKTDDELYNPQNEMFSHFGTKR